MVGSRRLRYDSATVNETMNAAPNPAVTQLLARWTEGDKQALEDLLPLVYDELRRLARRYLQQERPGHTLQSTALVHEAYLRLVDQNVSWQNRAHFFGIAAQMMRRILVDHARSRSAAKRGDGACRVTLDEGLVALAERDLDVVALDGALSNLAKIDPQQSKIVELRFFAGLSIEDTSEVLHISPATVKRDWAMAKAWLHREMRP
jgi:RNA polymerase sigma factor (TIGR02999 family)